MAKLTERQMDHLVHLADGTRHRPIRSATRRSCYIALVKKGLAGVERLQGTPGYVITDAGRAALSEANAAPIPPHDPSGVISDPLSSGDSEMQGRLPRGEEFVPDERVRTTGGGAS